MLKMLKNLFLISVLALTFDINLISTASTSAAATVNTDPFFKSDYQYVPALKTFFKVSSKKKSWFDAKATCSADGAELAVFWSKAEADAVSELKKALPEADRSTWIGLQDLLLEGEFETTNGVPISNVYVDWNDGEPNSVDGKEHCVVFSANGKYLAKDCTAKTPFICRKSADTITLNKQCENFDLAYKPTSLPNQCIKFHTEPRTWTDAYMICKAELGHLGIINSKEEAALYVREWAKYPEESLQGTPPKADLFLGYHDLFKQNEFLTISGKSLSEAGYNDWAPSQPDNRAGVEHCGGMFRDGKLNDVDCNIKAVFICEKDLDDILDVSLHARFQQET